MVGIYKIENKLNNKVYIGQSQDVDLRWSAHLSKLRCGTHANVHLQRAYDKYGADIFDFSVLEECSISELDAREMYWISKYDAFKSGYNQTVGGNGMRGWVVPEKTRLKISSSCRDLWNVPEYREKVISRTQDAMTETSLQKRRASQRARWADPEFKEKMREIRRVSFNRPEYIAEKSLAMKKLWEDPSYREKHSESMRKYFDSEAGKKRIIAFSDRMKVLWNDPEFRENTLAKIREYASRPEVIAHKREILHQCAERKRRPIICIETEKVYRCVLDAAPDFSCSPEMIKTACLGRTKSAGGFHFAYFTDEFAEFMRSEKYAEWKSEILKGGKYKPVICVETNTEYFSVMEASRQTGIDRTSIGKCCGGKKKTAGGYTWKYRDPFLVVLPT